ncbi:MAG TPA: sigma-70 family RNA polymerase sigma factor [Candidatus Hydrogenedentes bacterium]|nr:sigma-70 family RNA polymerase sigma factor [Candidatus Hydrogenedentota bacterium]HQH52691.1 sigma-70 family RNA polymerase sigma factor [Candidatus Hydrogenedentota bacterium]HQM49688.1 sigma-70 family RNA polymerase sigma factor [Candidatus Hydrogenedentota bacterium]
MGIAEMADSDKALLERWMREREPEAFRALCLQYAGMVYATCARVLRDPAKAEDVAQECFESLATMKKPPHGHLGPWLHKVATYRALNSVRSDIRRKEREKRYAESKTVHVELQWDDIYELIDEAIADLPYRLRRPLVGHFLEGKTHQAIARELGVSRPAVTQRIDRGIREIRKGLVRRGVPITASALAALFRANLAEATTVPASLSAGLGKLALSSGATPAGTAGFGSLTGTLAFKLAAGAILALAVSIGAAYLAHLKNDAAPPARAQPVALAVASDDSPAPTTKPETADEPRSAPGSSNEPWLPDQPQCSVSGRVLLSNWQPGDGPAWADAARLKIVDGEISGSTSMGWHEVEVGGEYSFTNFSPGTYVIRAQLRAAFGSKEIALNAGDNVTNFDIQIQPTDTALGGQVTDPDGHPLERVAVRVYSGMGTLFFVGETPTDRDGRYEFRHLRGAPPNAPGENLGSLYHIYFNKPAYHTQKEYHGFTLETGEHRLDLDTVMVPGQYVLYGRVETSSGHGAPGLEVSGAGQSTQTARDGTFALPNLYGPCDVRVTLTHKDPWCAVSPEKFEYPGGGDCQGALFTVEPGGTVTGILKTCDGGQAVLTQLTVDDDHLALEPFVESRSWRERAFKGPYDANQRVTVSSGTPFRFVGVPPGSHRLIVLSEQSFAPCLSDEFTVSANETADLGEVVLSHGGTVRGTILVEAENFELEWVKLKPAGREERAKELYAPAAWAEVDHVEEQPRELRFEFEQVMPGRHEVHYQGRLAFSGRTQNFADIKQVDVRDGEITWMTFPPKGVEAETSTPPRQETVEGDASLAGIVVWDNGAPAAGASWEVESGSIEREGVTDGNGRFRAEGLNPDGNYRLRVIVEGQRHKEYYHPQDGLRIVFNRPATVSGRLLYADSRLPVQRAAFLVLTEGDTREFGPGLDADGAFSFGFVPEAASAAMAIVGPDFAPIVTDNFTLNPGAGIDLGTVHVQAGLEVTGTVATPEGEPVPFVNIQASPVWSPGKDLHGNWGDTWTRQRTAITDSSGRFTLQNMAEGTHRISLEGPGYVPATQELDIQPGMQLALTLNPAEAAD